MPTVPGYSQSRDERGFTLVELLTAIVVLGLIMAPLTMAVVQAMRVVPQSNTRTGVATDAARLLTTFTRDIGNANSQWANASGKILNTPVNAWDGTSTGTVACPASGQPTIVEADWNDLAQTLISKQTEQYVVKSVSAGSSVAAIEIHRVTSGIGVSNSDELYLSGYCKLSSTFATTKVKTVSGVEDVQVTLSLTDQNGAPLTTVVLDGNVRST